jgi:hypothetical protein
MVVSGEGMETIVGSEATKYVVTIALSITYSPLKYLNHMATIELFGFASTRALG